MRVATVALAALMLCACGDWRASVQKSIVTTHEAAKALHHVGAPLIFDKCVELAHACRSKGDTVCKPARECLAKRRKLDAVLVVLHRTLALASTAVATEDENGAGRLVAQALGLLMDARSMLAEFGLGVSI